MNTLPAIPESKKKKEKLNFIITIDMLFLEFLWFYATKILKNYCEKKWMPILLQTCVIDYKINKMNKMRQHPKYFEFISWFWHSILSLSWIRVWNRMESLICLQHMSLHVSSECVPFNKIVWPSLNFHIKTKKNDSNAQIVHSTYYIVRFSHSFRSHTPSKQNIAVRGILK